MAYGDKQKNRENRRKTKGDEAEKTLGVKGDGQTDAEAGRGVVEAVCRVGGGFTYAIRTILALFAAIAVCTTAAAVAPIVTCAAPASLAVVALCAAGA